MGSPGKNSCAPLETPPLPFLRFFFFFPSFSVLSVLFPSPIISNVTEREWEKTKERKKKKKNLNSLSVIRKKERKKEAESNKNQTCVYFFFFLSTETQKIDPPILSISLLEGGGGRREDVFSKQTSGDGLDEAVSMTRLSID